MTSTNKDHKLAADLKAAMRRMPSTVALVTTRDSASGAPAGLVASAVIPVSMAPPSMLISVNLSASAHGAIERSGLFCVNLLGIEQANMVGPFSNSDLRDRRFADGPWEERDGIPYLADAAASIFCQVRQTLKFGTHELFIGQVYDVRQTADVEPLGWLEGEFARLGRLALTR
jgi:flavin reductase (DIM6/NTAB) family NADH-FMN oxidoreductase RutF